MKNMSFNPLRKKRTRKALLILFDIFCFIAIDAVYYLSTVFFDKSLKYEEPKLFLLNSAILLAVTLAIRMIAGIYYNVWRYTNTTTYMKMVLSDGGIAPLF